jgi:TolB-like protein
VPEGDDLLGDGVIVEDIITALSRVGWFFVIARKGRAADITPPRRPSPPRAAAPEAA